MAALLAAACRRTAVLAPLYARPAAVLAAAPAAWASLAPRSPPAAGFHSCAAAAAPPLPVPPPRGARGPTTQKQDRRRAGAGTEADPFFREVWRRFQLKVHPDLFTKFPDLQKANADSLQKLQGLLNECKSGQGRCTSDILQPRSESVEFFLRTERDNAFMRVPMTFRVPGGNCRNVVGASFSELFRVAGLPDRFRWGPEYWMSTFIAPARREADDGDD